MNAKILVTIPIFAISILLPYTSMAQYHSSTSMEIFSMSSSQAKDCYRAATIAGRIHYTSRKEIENCSFALDYTAISLRDRAATLANRGIIYMALEDYQSAVRDYSASLKLKPDFGEIYVNIGNVYYIGKVYDRAVQEYTSALENNTSKSHIAYYNRGMAYENLGDYENAEADYKTAMDISPEWTLPQEKLSELQTKKVTLEY